MEFSGVTACSGWSAQEARLVTRAAMALHSSIDVKCARRPGELSRTAIPVPTRQAGGVASRSAIDVKCARCADCIVELRGTTIHVPT
jgi:hypothetical protein